MNTELEQLFRLHKGYLTRDDIPRRGLYYKLLELVNTGEVTRLKPGVFCLDSEVMDRNMIDVGKIVPGGVLCLYSAWAHYELTTQIPQSFHIAVDKRSKVTLPDYPPITLYYWEKKYWQLGIQEKQIEGIQVKIYDMEKSVCDAVRYRTKIGIEISSEILRNYLHRKDRNLSLLIHYASSMRIAAILKKYLEIQL